MKPDLPRSMPRAVALTPLTRAVALVLATGLALAGACMQARDQSPPDVREPLALASGRVVDVATLRHGAAVYTAYCRPCHGARGDGRGPSAPGLRPPPRDFRAGVFKFAAVAGGQLPNDDDLRRVIKSGLHGTAMLAWGVPDAEVDALIQYLKTFSPRWKEDKPGDPITLSADPWRGHASDGIQRGQKLFHSLARCAAACHPYYATRTEITVWAKELLGPEATVEARDDMYGSLAKESDYLALDAEGEPQKGADGNPIKLKLLPPDFTFQRLRAGDTVEDIARTVASGVGGTAMPTWKDALPDADIWALSHYVRSLVELRDTPAADALRRRLTAAR